MRTGRYRHFAELQAAVVGEDELKGRTESQWPRFGDWRCSVTEKPLVLSETESAVIYMVEGLYRQDLWDRFYGGDTIRLVITGMTTRPLTLKAMEVINPDWRNKVLVVHAAKAIET